MKKSDIIWTVSVFVLIVGLMAVALYTETNEKQNCRDKGLIWFKPYRQPAICIKAELP
jgi:hypothetical protein